MKAQPLSRKLVLCAVMALAVVGMLVPMATVSAADQDWPLELIGATTINVTQGEFEAMAAANPSNTYTDTDNNTWRGLALWRLIALVDDGDPTTFNDALSSVYSIRLYAYDGFTRTISPPYSSVFDFARSEDIFVANEVQLSGTTEFVELPLDYYPLRVNGSGCTTGGQRIRQLIRIELLNLPVTAVSVSPTSQSVDNGASFTIDLAIDTDTAVRGWQARVDFDPGYVQCSGVTEGGFLKDWASANGGGTIPAGTATIDNIGGIVTIPGYAITGATGPVPPGPTGTGTLCTLSFTANDPVDTFADFILSDVVVSDVDGDAIPGVVLIDGQAAIGDVPMPDLVVSALSAAKDGEGTYAITYTITNQGNDAASASTTSIVIDGGDPQILACPALTAGDNYTETLPAQSFSSPTDTIVVTADSANDVAEGSEANNARQIVYALAGDSGDVIVNGNILAKLILTVPSDILDWTLKAAEPNIISRTANVKCNTPWQLQVSDQNGDTNGHMTMWNGAYDTSVQLANPLYVGSEIDVALSGSNQLIADGVVEDQNADDGQDLNVTFSQQVFFSDPVLSGDYSYRIVVTFTASSTF